MPQRQEIGYPRARTIEMVGADGSPDPDWEWDGHDWMVGLISSTPHKVVPVEWARTVGAGLTRPIGTPHGPYDGIYWDEAQQGWFKPDKGTTVFTAGAPVVHTPPHSLVPLQPPTVVNVHAAPAPSQHQGGFGIGFGGMNLNLSLDKIADLAIKLYDAFGTFPPAPALVDANNRPLGTDAQLQVLTAFTGAVEARKHKLEQFRTLEGILKILAPMVTHKAE